MQSGTSQGGLINITHNDSTFTTVPYSRKWSEQYRDVQASRTKENSQHLLNHINFFKIHNPSKVPVNEFVNANTGVTVTDYITFHVIDRCAWLFHIYWVKVGNIKDL